MNSILSIFYKTKSTYDFLDNQFEDDLEIKNTLIFFLIGLVTATEGYFKGNFERFGIIWIILAFVLGAGLTWIIGNYLISYIIFWIGKLLKGKATILLVQTIVAYSMLPRLLRLPITIYYGLTGKYQQLTNLDLFVLNGLYLVISLLILKIAIQGLIRFNNYGLPKALLNLSPWILFGLTSYLIFLFKTI